MLVSSLWEEKGPVTATAGAMGRWPSLPFCPFEHLCSVLSSKTSKTGGGVRGCLQSLVGVGDGEKAGLPAGCGIYGSVDRRGHGQLKISLRKMMSMDASSPPFRSTDPGLPSVGSLAQEAPSHPFGCLSSSQAGVWSGTVTVGDAAVLGCLGAP